MTSNGGYDPRWHQVNEASSLQVDDLILTCSCCKSECKSCKCRKNMKWARFSF